MKKNFFTGLVIVLPFFLTVYIIWLTFKIVGRFFTPFFAKLFETLYVAKIPDSVITLISAIVTLFLIWLIGLLASNIIGKKLLKFAETFLMKVPMASGIYDAFKKLMKLFFSDKSNFQRVVMIEWPRRGVYCIAFMTAVASGEVQEKTKENVVNVFLPTTPNPTTGFLVLVPKEDVKPLDMSVDEAIKLIMSGGIITPPYKKSEEKPVY